MQRSHRTEDTPFSILVLGDFQGRGLAGAPEGDGPDWRPVRVDPDEMMDLAGMEPRLVLGVETGRAKGARVDLQRLEDLHPDQLFRRHPLFQELRQARAAAEKGPAEPPTDDPGPRASGDADPGDPADAESPGEGRGLLDSIVEEGSGAPEGGESGAMDPDLREFVRKIVRPHIVRSDPDRAARVASVDRAASDLMRVVLHDPGFQELESLWRSVVFLLSNTDTSGKVRTYIVDVSRAELAADLREGGPGRSRLARLLSEPDPGPPGGRWGVAVGAYTFGGGETGGDSPEVVEGIAALARAADVPWISGAHPRLPGLDALEPSPDAAGRREPWPDGWARIPECEGASWLGLALPRFLVREPYGEDSSRRCRAFEFREEPADGGSPGPRPLLWGNPAFLPAVLLARAFARSGWRFRQEDELDVGQMPIAPGGGGDTTPVLTEERLTREQAAYLAASGFIPLVAFPREARIRAAGVRSVASAGRRLSAWWNP